MMLWLSLGPPDLVKVRCLEVLVHLEEIDGGSIAVSGDYLGEGWHLFKTTGNQEDHRENGHGISTF